MDFPASYRWSVYVVRKSPKVALNHFCYLNKIQFQSNKIYYIVSLCENFQRQSCSITIPPSNGP